jgi:hypothetical protein
MKCFSGLHLNIHNNKHNRRSKTVVRNTECCQFTCVGQSSAVGTVLN